MNKDSAIVKKTKINDFVVDGSNALYQVKGFQNDTHDQTQVFILAKPVMNVFVGEMYASIKPQLLTRWRLCGQKELQDIYGSLDDKVRKIQKCQKLLSTHIVYPRGSLYALLGWD